MAQGYGSGSNRTTDPDEIVNLYKATYSEGTGYTNLTDASGSDYTVPVGKKFILSYFSGWDNLSSSSSSQMDLYKQAGDGTQTLIYPKFGGPGSSEASNTWAYNVTITIAAGFKIQWKNNQSNRGGTGFFSGLEVTA